MKADVMDSSSILGEPLVALALKLATPTINQFMEVKSLPSVWGPRFIIMCVVHTNLASPMFFPIGSTAGWKSEWKKKPDDFREIALWKAEKARDTGMPTSLLVDQFPLDLVKGDFLYAGGVPLGKHGGVGGSGLKGFGDEGAASVLAAIITMLCKLKFETLRQLGIGQLT